MFEPVNSAYSAQPLMSTSPLLPSTMDLFQMPFVWLKQHKQQYYLFRFCQNTVFLLKVFYFMTHQNNYQ